jgi:hypothetical protein
VSGYGGQPPSGWQDPYGSYGQQQPQQQPPSGWQDPYGSYGQQPPQQQAPSGWQDPYGYGYGYGPPGVPPGGGGNGSAVAALVVSIVEVVLCGGLFAVPGIVLAAIAMGRFKTDPVSARKLTVWAWICAGIAPVISIILIVLYLVYIDNSTPTTTY